jgi:hypothetical protein
MFHKGWGAYFPSVFVHQGEAKRALGSEISPCQDFKVDQEMVS